MTDRRDPIFVPRLRAEDMRKGTNDKRSLWGWYCQVFEGMRWMHPVRQRAYKALRIACNEKLLSVWSRTHSPRAAARLWNRSLKRLCKPIPPGTVIPDQPWMRKRGGK